MDIEDYLFDLSKKRQAMGRQDTAHTGASNFQKNFSFFAENKNLDTWHDLVSNDDPSGLHRLFKKAQ